MHFTYDAADGDLKQGDLIARSPELETVLKDIHPHYANKDSNTHFLVLTQTCDLVLGRGGDPCKSRYISIAPVRPLSDLLGRQIEKAEESGFDLSIPVCTTKSKVRMQQFLERLFNNNESAYFYLHQEPAVGLTTPSCAYLRLSIALKASLHYEKLLKARVVSLNDTFQAKLGWLTGQMYSRVGTQDWEASEMKALVKDCLNETVFWVDEKKRKEILNAVADWKTKNEGRDLNTVELEGLINSLIKRKQQVIERVSFVLTEAKELSPLFESGQLTERELSKIKRRLEQDPQLSSLLK